MLEYKKLVCKIISEGTRREATRGGVDTIGIFNYNYQHDLANGFPLLTTKPINWKNIVIENLWFLSGEPTVDFLHKHHVHIWDPWIVEQPTGVKLDTSFYEVRADGEYYVGTTDNFHTSKVVPSAYGNFWRRFADHRSINNLYQIYQGDLHIDQVYWALDKLKNNPATRQAVITSWDPRNAITSSLPPCHVMHILNIHDTGTGVKRLNLHLTQRSCDVALGLPYNIAGYAFLLSLYARFLGYQPGVFAHSIVDAHIYTRSLDGSNAEYDHLPGLAEQISRAEKPLPILKIDDKITGISSIDELVRSNASTEEIMSLFKLDGYPQHYNPIYFKPAV